MIIDIIIKILVLVLIQKRKVSIKVQLSDFMKSVILSYLTPKGVLFIFPFFIMHRVTTVTKETIPFFGYR